MRPRPLQEQATVAVEVAILAAILAVEAVAEDEEMEKVSLLDCPETQFTLNCLLGKSQGANCTLETFRSQHKEMTFVTTSARYLVRALVLVLGYRPAHPIHF